MSTVYKSPCKTVGGNEGSKCLYKTRIDTFGCGCQHDCSYCFAKTQLDRYGNWNAGAPRIADIRDIEREIKNMPKGSIVRLGGMTDCFQPREITEKITYKTILLLNKYRKGYLIATKSHLVAENEYLRIYDKSLAHFQISVTCFDDRRAQVYEKCSLPSMRVKALLKLQYAGLDVALRLSPFIDEYIDYSTLNGLNVDKCIIEFLRINSSIKKAFHDVDYAKYTLWQSNYRHLPLDEKCRMLEKVKLTNVSICEDVTEHYYFWQKYFNPMRDCCNLRIKNPTVPQTFKEVVTAV